MYLYLCVFFFVYVFYVTLSHIIADNLLKLQHTPGNYPGTGCVLVPNPRKLCFHLTPHLRSHFTLTALPPSTHCLLPLISSSRQRI